MGKWTVDDARTEHARAWAIASASDCSPEALAALANAHDTLVLAIGELQAEIAELRAGDAVRRGGLTPGDLMGRFGVVEGPGARLIARLHPELVDWKPVPDVHSFDQIPGVMVAVCRCGKWPDHHIHTGDRETCLCDECRGQAPTG